MDVYRDSVESNIGSVCFQACGCQMGMPQSLGSRIRGGAWAR